VKVLQVYNEQRSRFGGEPAVIDATMRLLAQNGHDARLVMKSSRVLENSLLKRVNAFWGGVYNLPAHREMARLIESDRPDVVHVHSVYPMFSPSVLVACRQKNVPVVMTVHSHNLTCPTWYHLYQGAVCEDCVGGHEYRCVVKNCRDNYLESAAYALRSSVARRFRLFHDNVTVLIVLTSFAKAQLMKAGFREDQIQVVPNPASVREHPADPSQGNYVAFAGRISPEKGLRTLMDAAARLPHIAFKIAGDGPALQGLKPGAPANVQFMGQLAAADLDEFYKQARMLVVPSVWFEQFPMVVLEAMGRGLPVVGSRIGGLPAIIDDGVTGALFDPGNAADLAGQLQPLWDDPARCLRMGLAGREKVIRNYTEATYFNNLMNVYQTAIGRIARGAGFLPVTSLGARRAEAIPASRS
jgi:glycosyltransferase involved in cell wall biosynthesis